MQINHLILQAPQSNVIFKFKMAYSKDFKTNGSVVISIKIVKISSFKYTPYPDWRLRRHDK